MTFIETLNKARENNIDVLDLSIAYECESAFEFEYTEEEFEKLCARAKEIFLKGENLTEWAIAYAINDLIQEENKTIKDVLEMDKWKIINNTSIIY